MIRHIMTAGNAQTRLWTPSELTTPPTVWLNDQSRITITSLLVSSWFSLPKDNWDFTNASRPTPLSAGATDSLGGKRTLSFQGTAAHLSVGSGISGDIFRNTNAVWFMAIMKKIALDGSNTNRVVLFNSTITSAVPRFCVRLGTATTKNTFQIQVRGSDAESTKTLADSSELADTNFHIFMATMSYITQEGKLYIDGVEVASNSALTDSAAATSDTGSVNALDLCALNSTQWADVVLGEVLIGTGSVPSTDERYRLEGYLAHRWKSKALLPGGHQHETQAPRTLPWT